MINMSSVIEMADQKNHPPRNFGMEVYKISRRGIQFSLYTYYSDRRSGESNLPCTNKATVGRTNKSSQTHRRSIGSTAESFVKKLPSVLVHINNINQ